VGEARRRESTPASPLTLLDALDAMVASGYLHPEQAEWLRCIADSDTFAVLVDRLPHMDPATEREVPERRRRGTWIQQRSESLA
jgi:hypothetical protein